MSEVKAAKPKAFSYLRFSTPEQTKGDSFKRQTRMALEYAARNGLELDESLTFHDLGVSAYRGLNAEAGRLADFLEAVRVGLVPTGSYLLVEALDRLSRLTPRKAVRVLEDIVEAGVTVVTLNDGRAYTAENLDDDPVSLLVAIVYFMRANEESATKSRRLKSAWESKRNALDTKPLTAVVPAWIRLDQETGTLQLIPERADIIRRIFEMHQAGTGVALIAATLNREGVPCFGAGAHWHRTYIRKVLSNPAAMGTFIPHRLVYLEGKRTRVPLEPVPDYFPAVVSSDEFSSAQRQVETPARHRAGKVVNLLAGLAKCPKCGSTMTRVNKGSGTKAAKPKLVCTRAKAGAGCEYKAVTLEDVEDALVSSADYLSGSAPSGAGTLDADLAEAEQAIEVTRESIDNLVSVLAATPSQAVAARLSELETALEALNDKRDHLAAQVIAASGPLLVKRLDELEAALSAEPRDNAKANAMLRTMFGSITVDYETGTLEMHWKQGGVSSLTYAWPSAAR
ncbi:recombinase family protein [Burkholderia cepacia]|uniref:recombinase family protein n=1 Tax=Burkholderia cepacia TaxID=292 RepID=UPI000F5AE6DE|nr:recombinase family protein [Burkholderia cepacia]RQT46842.1 recombinase family protein [Burkholderia cepacia]